MKFSHIFSENALKLTYGNVEFQKFPGVRPRTPLLRGGEKIYNILPPPHPKNPGDATGAITRCRIADRPIDNGSIVPFHMGLGYERPLIPMTTKFPM
jgi:hypothetical protein